MGNTAAIPLVTSEISGIWNSYVGENQFVSIIKYFLNRVDDEDTKALLRQALDLSNQRINTLTNIFNSEKLPLPEGFTDMDVDINAPRLFTDVLYLQYLLYSSRVAMMSYSHILKCVARSDIRDYFSKCVQESINLYNGSAELALSKGIFIRAPHVEVPKEVQNIESESFMIEWFGKRRPLLTEEITHIYSVTNDTIIRKALLIGFLQVCKDRQIVDYISKVIDLAKKQNSNLTKFLIDEGIPVAGTSDNYVTDSTVSPFTDKLILNKILILYRMKIHDLGIALGDIKRSDLTNYYMKALSECIKYAEEGAAILISRGWMQQPPQAINHESLVGV